MRPYMLLAVAFRFFVDFFMFFAVKRIFSPYSGPLFPLLGAAAGALYAGCSMLERLSFLQASHWYLLSSILCCLLVFGFSRRAIAPGAVFCLLRLALDGLSDKNGGFAQVLLAIVMCAALVYGFGGRALPSTYVPVELNYAGKTVRLQALWDTGHELRDPVTGKGVVVIDCNAANKLTGLQPELFKKPVEAMGAIPGLRLIPYQTVGASGQMMLALMVADARIGRKRRPCLVAFAPQVLDNSGKFQALIGGAV